MDNRKPIDITELPKEDLLHMVGIFLGDVLVHYGMWFTESVHEVGPEQALEFDSRILPRYAASVLQRFAPHFGIELENGIPRVLAEKSREELLLLIGDLAKTWVVGDGLWFQAVESSTGMERAKEINDVCWSHFAQMEAFKIRRYLGLDKNGGLHALEKAMRLRIYSSINAHASSWDADGSLLFSMTECRVQAARRRKQMEDYPCKSAGIVEYTLFARAIDPRIKTQCVWCPPDRVPDEAFCTWRFTMEGE
jgi:hypothetical protein